MVLVNIKTLKTKQETNNYKSTECWSVEANYGRRRKCLGKKEVCKKS